MPKFEIVNFKLNNRRRYKEEEEEKKKKKKKKKHTGETPVILMGKMPMLRNNSKRRRNTRTRCPRYARARRPRHNCNTNNGEQDVRTFALVEN
ncbi:MAG: hypothetical protein EHM48_03990 [Planctomycetaceae bacterium]|nr:MAG: hypothetical protein EHM48_03990 [Planctomycetaceae bacterium]